MDQPDSKAPSTSTAGNAVRDQSPSDHKPLVPYDFDEELLILGVPEILLPENLQMDMTRLFPATNDAPPPTPTDFTGLGSNEALWSIPVDDAHSSLEIATSPQTCPNLNLGDLLQPSDILEASDSPRHQSSVPRPATRAPHNGNPRSPRFRSNGAYHTKPTFDDYMESLFGDTVIEPDYFGNFDPVQTAGEFACLIHGCSFETESYSELTFHYAESHINHDGIPWHCDIPGCSIRTFGRKRDLDNHRRLVHQEQRALKAYVCRHDSCSTRNPPLVFQRRYNLARHLRVFHQVVNTSEITENFIYDPNVSVEAKAEDLEEKDHDRERLSVEEEQVEEERISSAMFLPCEPTPEQERVDSNTMPTHIGPPEDFQRWRGSKFYQDLGNHFRRLQQDGTTITYEAIMERARSLKKTQVISKMVEKLTGPDGMNIFAQDFSLSVLRHRYNNPPSAHIEPPASHDSVKNLPRGVSLSHPDILDGSRSAPVRWQLRFSKDTRLESKVDDGPSSSKDIPFTDSGYASVPHLLSSPERKSRGVEAQKPALFTDIGNDDSKTAYSVTTNAMPGLTKETIWEVCKDIHTKITTRMINIDWASISHAVPTLIKAFAIKIGTGNSSVADRSIMHFVHRHHQQMCDQLQITFEQDDENSCERGGRSLDVMPLRDKMSLWGQLSDRAPQSLGKDELFQGIEDPEDEEDEAIPGSVMPQYSQTILSSQAYHWLVASLLKQSSYHWDESHPRTMADGIQKPIIQSLPKERIRRKKDPYEHRVAFWLPWHPIRLRIEEEEATRKSSLISDFVALVGSSADQIQAIPIRQYFEQTWALGGAELLDAIQHVIDRRARSQSYTAKQARVQASLTEFALVVIANGPTHFVAECGQQLAWLGASLQSPQLGQFSSNKPGLVAISARPLSYIVSSLVGYFKVPAEVVRNVRLGQDTEQTEYPEHNWAITVESDQQESLLPDASFEPLVPCFSIRGYPTLRRPSSCAGLEVPREIVSTLLKSARYTNTHLSIGTVNFGFQLGRIQDSVLVWHLTESLNQVCPCGFRPLPWDDFKCLVPDYQLNFSNYRHVFESCHGAKGFAKPGNLVPGTAESAGPGLTEILGSGSSTHTSSRYASIDSDMLSISSASDEILSKTRNPEDPMTQLLETAACYLLGEFRKEVGFKLGFPCSRSLAPTCPSASAADDEQSSNSEGQTGTQANGDSVLTRQPGGQFSRPQPGHKSKLLACPFWKFDPVKHGKCFKFKLSKVSYVKQHLQRIHAPKFYCERCLDIFESRDRHEFHNRYTTCNWDASRRLNGISHQQVRELIYKSKQDLSEADKWFVVWGIVFPSEQRPASAYVDHGLSEDLCHFRDFTKSRGTGILLESFQSSGFSLTGLDVGSLLPELLDRGLDQLYNEWLAIRDSPNQTNATDWGSRLQQSEVSTGSFVDSGITTRSYRAPPDPGLHPQPVEAVPITDTVQAQAPIFGQQFNFEGGDIDLPLSSGFDDISGNPFDFDNEVSNWLTDNDKGWGDAQAG